MHERWIMMMRNARHRRRQHIHVLRRTLETAALLDQESAKRRRTRGNEAPMVIGPRDVASLLRQLVAAIRGTKK
jgi:hypothetical protein